jgi:hypothetical protein
METGSLIGLMVDIFNMLVLSGFVVESYIGLDEARTIKKFVMYGVAVIVGMMVFIYNTGRVVMVWLS